MSKLAIIQCGDTGPVESLVRMLTSVGYECKRVGSQLADRLARIGCDTVITSETLVNSMGYLIPKGPIGIAVEKHIEKCDLFVDVKAHRSYSKLVNEWPNLGGKILWYRINGGKPEHVINSRGDHGDEVNPPCPVITPNQWYKNDRIDTTTEANKVWMTSIPCNSYVFWPSFERASSYTLPRPVSQRDCDRPICLIHNYAGWGYSSLGDRLRRKGLRIFGKGSPDGLLINSQIPNLLSKALCMIHLKSNDAPGYALYEAIYARCPIILPRRLIWRCKMEKLFKEYETCLCFDVASHESLDDNPKLQQACIDEIEDGMAKLYNNQLLAVELTSNALDRLTSMSWSHLKPSDVQSLRDFMQRNFP